MLIKLLVAAYAVPVFFVITSLKVLNKQSFYILKYIFYTSKNS